MLSIGTVMMASAALSAASMQPADAQPVETAGQPAATETAQAEGTEESWQPTAATRIQCRRLPQRVGSRIGTRRVCATQMQWDRWRQENRDVLENAGNRSRVGGY